LKLSEHPLGLAWLQQFNHNDVHAARFALDSLKLVSHRVFENSIINTVTKFLEENDGTVAALLVHKKISSPDSDPGSEDRLGHIMTNVRRRFGERLLINPGQEEMKRARVDHVILLDDFVASGTRISQFWDDLGPIGKTLNSWFSYDYCKLWLIGYAIHQNGKAKALQEFPSLTPERLRFEIHLEDKEDYWPKPLLDFFERNQYRSEVRSSFESNFGGILSPLVFQHGCPDNAPTVFIKDGDGFSSLFPNRSILMELDECFDHFTDSYRGAELLWKSGQPTLAIKTLDAILNNSNSSQIELITILGLIAAGLSAERLATTMTTSVSTVEELLTRCRDLSLINEEMKITPIGHDILKRTKKQFISPPTKKLEPSLEATFYIPKQFSGKSCGVQ